jgi:hypothetical protein
MYAFLLRWVGLPRRQIADTSAVVYLGVKAFWPNTPGEEAMMPILLWYLPFTMFSGTCDLVFSEFESQTAGVWPAESLEPLPEFDDPDNVVCAR